ncbi:MAG: hypothetical protein JRN27_01990 [Nitrososphaerota archaeon]|nr:hypothetical protein [Nitrososphaerota archaeon]MDG6974856.1 hypothetical protein [Nitrososphaerota archaeon]
MSRPKVFSGRQGLAVGIVFGGAGGVLALLDMSLWAENQYALALSRGVGVGSSVVDFFASEAAVLAVMASGIYLVYRGARAMDPGNLSLPSIIGAAFSSRKTMRLAVGGGILYAFAFLFLSGTLVYQPTVDFSQVYGASSPGWASAVCCGTLGSVPELKLYLFPALHLGAQLLPLTLLMLVLVPPLVTLNIAVALGSLRQKALRSGRLVTSVGALVGLVTGCPTCAGYFLLSAAGGLGASAFTFVLAPYQLLFVVVSLPLLVIGPFLTAYGQRKALSSACEIPGAPD